MSHRGNTNELTPREREVLRLSIEGRSNTQIGAQLGIAAGTVNSYRQNLYHKLNVYSIQGLTKFAHLVGMQCPNCRTVLAFQGDECGLCKEASQA